MDQKCLICIFFGGIWRKYCHIWSQHPWICLVAKFSAKIKILKFGTKNTWFGYFWTGLWKQHCHIWNQHPRICLITKFREKIRMSKFGTKNTLFGKFWVRTSKKYCHMWNQHPQFCLITKFCKKTPKMLKFGTKNALFGYFWARILKEVLPYLKAALSNWSNFFIYLFFLQYFYNTRIPKKLRPKHFLE